MNSFSPQSPPQKPRGQRKTQDPCPKCQLHKALCICAQIPTLNLRTRVSLIVHTKELRRTTNTGSLAIHALTNSELIVRGGSADNRDPLDLSRLVRPDYRNVLFFPADNARTLDAAFMAEDARPVHLIVPDGNWRQASKVNTRHPELAELPRVMISAANLAKHHLRAESSLEGMATLQAIAEAIGVTEESSLAREGASARDELMKLYEAKLHATLKGRNVF